MRPLQRAIECCLALWIVSLSLPHCPGGTFSYQPNRENNPQGFAAAPRLAATATTAAILSWMYGTLQMIGAEPVLLTAETSYCPGVDDALGRAGDNREELARALEGVPAEQRAGMEFLIEHMPERDLTSLKADFLLENVDYAYRARKEAPWGKRVPEEIFLNDVLPYANVTERRDPWRKDFYERFLPLVKDCKTPSAAAALLNAKVFPQLNVRYSRQRRRADQGPTESIETGTASCTGLSILLVDACRAVGVPARFVGTPLWSDRSGNHSWVEIWDDGWHFTGAAEPSGDRLDQAWFVARASSAQRDTPIHAIYAVSYRPTPLEFPVVWSRGASYVHAVNVTDRYTVRKKDPEPGWTRMEIRVLERAGGARVAASVILRDPETGKTLFEGTSRDERFDGNDHLVAEVPLKAEYRVEVRSGDRVLESTLTPGTTTAVETLILSESDP